ncbi:HET-domain-containing protein [Hypoxylon rubiginosum]|uniref:HET-domain-containing protein n=1 Tax=Hypoxylon rubiginosum TaxID=110542 RepID=A0ACB9YNJ8_9PEZI|nr:HET-domain-containing protein [Hypoxylon rubiginosum]
MWLINTKLLELKEFHGNIPPYAVLSHVWVGGEEVSFREFADASPATKMKSGYGKIRDACDMARRDRIAWMWVDTSCIDKSSSAELTEAINSMYNWYRDSTTCYAYLDDVPCPDGVGESDDETLRSFRRSRWYLRGWTLQELIAPPRLAFFSREWHWIGDRRGLADEISAVTGIEPSLLRGQGGEVTEALHQVSIAKKMSWAARRATTRAEDIAYCLLGLFDVNMPLLYGEGGAKAFARLQEEIIKTSNDHTIFCWSRGGGSKVPATWTSMLAPSPAAFLDAGDYVPADAWDAPMPCSMTNLGLSICLPVIYTLTQLFVVLDARVALGETRMRACIAVQRTNPRRSGSNILDRSRFLSGPVILSKEATDIRERYRLYIWSRHVRRPGTLHRMHKSPGFKHGVLLFVNPTATRLLSPGKRDAPLGSMGYDIITHPSGIFDEDTALLRLWEGSAFLASGLMRIRFKSPQDTDIYLFFAVMTTLTGREVWYCSVHLAEEVGYIKLALQESIAEARAPEEVEEGEFLTEEALIHLSFRDEAWRKNRRQLTARTADESLFVSVGGAMTTLRPGADVKAAMLSGKCESPYSVPVSATDLSPVVYEEDDDDDYMDDSDWGSSNEEEYQDEEDGSNGDRGSPEKEKGISRWDTSSTQSSQIFSSQTLPSAS